MNLDVALCPAELAGVDLTGRAAVVIDVLRATTTVTAALESGAAAVIPHATLDECRGHARREPGVLLGGERGGIKPADFDLGNSPGEYTPEKVGGKRIAFSTTNGTRALLACRGAESVLLGCLNNRAATAERLAELEADTLLVCSAKQGRPNLEDTLCAGLLVERLRELVVGMQVTDRARLSLELAHALPPTPDNLARSDHGRLMLELGLRNDIQRCAELDVRSTVGRWTGGEIII